MSRDLEGLVSSVSQDNSSDGIAEWDDIEDDGVLDSSDTLEGDLVTDPLDTGVEGAVDRYVAMTRATRQLVVLTSP